MANSVNREQVRLAKEALLGRLVPDLIHQLRNPLNSILTSAELLEENGESAKLRETLLPVVSRSASRIRDLLSALDSSVESSIPRGVELRSALREGGKLLQCRRHTVDVVGPGEGESVALGGAYEELWVLLLSVFEDSLCAAKDRLNVEVRCEEGMAHVRFEHDGGIGTNSGKNSSGSSREFTCALAQSLGGAVYYDALEPVTVLSLPKAVPKVQK